MQPETRPPDGGTPPPENPGLSPQPTEQASRRIEIKGKDAAECMGFARLLTDIAGQLSNVADDRFDEEVIGCLRQLVEFLGFDRSTLFAFSEYGSRFQAKQSWAVEGVPVAPGDLLINERMPWFTHQIRSGHIVSVSSSFDLPAVAAKELAYLKQSGVESLLAIPLLMEGAIIGALSFASVRGQRQWSPGLVARLPLLGEIMALGIRRNQYARGLKAIAGTLDLVSLDHAAPGQRAAEHARERAMRLMQAEHLERRRMGQVLHEDVMQILSAARMFVESGQDGTPPAPVCAKATSLLQEAIQKLRQLTLELWPEAVFVMPLARGFLWLANQVRSRYDLTVDVRVADAVDPVSDDVRTFLYDSARKLLENVAVHSACKCAVLEIRRSDPHYMQLIVSDEGVGFSVAVLRNLPSSGFGLFSIREQAELLGGMLEVSSSPSQGTRVVVTVALDD